MSVGTYPERHPQSPTLLHDIEILKQKVDAGATRAITQFFFDNSVYFRFLDVAAAAGLDVPIVPGIFPVQNFKQTANFARRTGASVPQWLADRFEGLEDDPATRRLVAAAVCAEQVIDLIDHGVERIALLHYEPRRSGVRDLSPRGPAAKTRAGGDRRRAERAAASRGGRVVMRRLPPSRPDLPRRRVLAIPRRGGAPGPSQTRTRRPSPRGGD